MSTGRRAAPPDRLTPLESQIMHCVWSLGEATSRQVKEQLDPDRPLAYTTVQTMMALLRDKGFLASRRRGRADVYRPLVDRERVGRDRLREVMELFFSGSASALVSHLVNLDDITDEEIETLRQAVQARTREE